MGSFEPLFSKRLSQTNTVIATICGLDMKLVFPSCKMLLLQVCHSANNTPKQSVSTLRLCRSQSSMKAGPFLNYNGFCSLKKNFLITVITMFFFQHLSPISLHGSEHKPLVIFSSKLIYFLIV